MSDDMRDDMRDDIRADMKADKRLWSAVILQALDDATMPAWAQEPNSRKLSRTQAREWLTKPNRDFDFVCGAAGVEPWQIRAKAAQLIQDADAGIKRPKQEKVTKPQQQLAVYTYKGETLTLKEWSQRTGIIYSTLTGRVLSGWSIERALTAPVSKANGGRTSAAAFRSKSSKLKKPTTPKKPPASLEWRGESHALADWARKLGFSYFVLRSRFKLGWSTEAAFTTPVQPRANAARQPDAARGVGRELSGRR
jgi:hypothetical protein